MRSQLCNTVEKSPKSTKKTWALGTLRIYPILWCYTSLPTPVQGLLGEAKTFKKKHVQVTTSLPFLLAETFVGYLPYTENSRAIKVKDVTALYIVRSAGIRDGDINSKISLMIGIFLQLFIMAAER